MEKKTQRKIKINRDPAFAYGDELEIIVPPERRGRVSQHTPGNTGVNLGDANVNDLALYNPNISSHIDDVDSPDDSISLDSVLSGEDSVFEAYEDDSISGSHSQPSLQDAGFTADDAVTAAVVNKVQDRRTPSSTRYSFLSNNICEFWSVSTAAQSVMSDEESVRHNDDNLSESGAAGTDGAKNKADPMMMTAMTNAAVLEALTKVGVLTNGIRELRGELARQKKSFADFKKQVINKNFNDNKECSIAALE